jgi:putative acetyltransferase
MMKIREARRDDKEQINGIYQGAFDEAEREPIVRLACELLTLLSDPPCLNLVAEEDGKLLSHVSFSPIWVKTEGRHLGYILAPLAVDPVRQKQGIGKALVQKGLERLGSPGAGGGVVLVYGDPAYYSRFGFTPEIAANYVPKYALEYPHGWQALALNTKATAKDPIEIHCVSPLNKPELW